EIEKLGSDLRAHHVQAEVLGPGVAATVAVEAGQRLRGARGEDAAKHVTIVIGHDAATSNTEPSDYHLTSSAQVGARTHHTGHHDQRDGTNAYGHEGERGHATHVP